MQIIDACAKGNLARFVNHSCDPNCRTEKVLPIETLHINLYTSLALTSICHELQHLMCFERVIEIDHIGFLHMTFNPTIKEYTNKTNLIPFALSGIFHLDPIT